MPINVAQGAPLKRGTATGRQLQGGMTGGSGGDDQRMGLLLVMPDLVENQLRVFVEGHRQQAADALRRGIADERGRVFAGRRKKQPSTVTGDQITDPFAPIRGQLQRVRIEQDDRVVGEQLLGLIPAGDR
jgi:hypothetical protein